jgi:hypothetical protein
MCLTAAPGASRAGAVDSGLIQLKLFAVWQ